MDYRINILTLFLLFSVASALSTSFKGPGGSRVKKKESTSKLSDSISENPFLYDYFPTTTTTQAHVPSYGGNPFLSNSPTPHLDNGTERNVIPANTNPKNTQKNQMVNIALYSHNPFLQSLTNTNGSSSNRNAHRSRRTKSDLKCEEYSNQVSKTAEVLSLVGTNPTVTKVTVEDCWPVNRLVIGGTGAAPGEYPHMVALGRRTSTSAFSLLCGGTLISPEWVLTAAHCTYGPDGSPNVVRMGFTELSDTQSGTTVNIHRIMRHPSYKPPAMYADIALMQLETAVIFNSTIRPACLYQLYDMVPSQAWVTGWGVTEFGGDESKSLQKALLDVVDNIACTIKHNQSLAVPYGITPSMICAGDPQGGKDTCQGDSGGPMQVLHPKYSCLYQVIGITSFGQGCALIGIPGVYTRVSHYLTWIEENVWPDA